VDNHLECLRVQRRRRAKREVSEYISMPSPVDWGDMEANISMPVSEERFVAALAGLVS
jgi:hypothetical protein